MYNILICDDDRDIVNALKIYLQDPSYTLFEAFDGLSVCQKIREFSNIPIVMLTAKTEDMDKILGLEYGADDYITKPFNPAEVTARVRSCLRRYLQLGAARISPEIITVGGIELCDSKKSVTVDGDAVSLTPTEYDILKFLMGNCNRVFSPKEIYRKIWNEDPLSADNTVAVHIRHIREKIEIDPANPRYLKAVWGHGYMMQG